MTVVRSFIVITGTDSLMFPLIYTLYVIRAVYYCYDIVISPSADVVALKQSPKLTYYS
jgi:hypothetical protein